MNFIPPLHDWVRRIRPYMLVGIFASIYILVTLGAHQWNPMSFVLIGHRFDPTAQGLVMGYDGQFAYQIAVDPLNGWQKVDVPAYRYQRIIYPMLARVVSLGSPAAIPWALIFINFAALVVGVALLESILVAQQANRWYALIYGLFIGLLMSLRLDLTEPLAYCLVQAAALLYLRGKHGPSALCFALAALTRETTLIFTAGYFLSLLSQKHIRKAVGWALAIGLPFAAWQVTLKLWLGNWGVGSGGALSTPFEWIPFRGWWGIAGYNFQAFLMLSLLVVPLAVVPAIAGLVTGVHSLVRGSRSPADWNLLLNAAMITILPSSNILDPLGLVRNLDGLVTAVLYYGAEHQSKRALRYACLWLFATVFLYADMLLPLY